MREEKSCVRRANVGCAKKKTFNWTDSATEKLDDNKPLLLPSPAAKYECNPATSDGQISWPKDNMYSRHAGYWSTTVTYLLCSSGITHRLTYGSISNRHRTINRLYSVGRKTVLIYWPTLS